MDNFIIYLLQVAACQSAFYVLYHFALKNHSFFQANRVFLLSGTLISFIIPLLSFEVWTSNIHSPFNGLTFALLENSSPANTLTADDIDQTNIVYWPEIFISIVFVIYMGGLFFKIFKIALGLKKVSSFIPGNKTNKNIILTQSGPPFFSFWKFIFINEQKLALNNVDLQQVIHHEQVHVEQLHTLDIIFIEIAVAICWFNPFIYKIRNALIQTHEYIADNKVISGDASVDEYSKLILQLSASKNIIPLTHQFSKINVINRIKMLNQSNSTKMKALKFLFTIPVLSMLLAIFSFTEKSSESSGADLNEKLQGHVIGEIQWKGNTKYTDEELTEVMEIKQGDIYNKKMVESLLIYNPEKTTIGDLYMDHGYLYFNVLLKDTIINESVNLTFEVYEGITATVDQIIIKGNETVEAQKILDMVEIKKGDLFNRAKLIESQRNIAESGYFDEGNVGIDPIPHDDGKKVDLEFTVHEIKRD